MKKVSNLPVLRFEMPLAWRQWLLKNHKQEEGIWIRFYKKLSGKKTITYAEALDEALCFGWIDGQTNLFDAKSYIQRFTPRRKRSIWSKRNIEHVKRLIKQKKMTAAGLAQYKLAQKDGRLDKAYDSPSKMTMPEDFLKELSKNKKALGFFKTLNKANTYAIAWRLQTAKKPETREKRMKLILEMMKNQKKFH